MVMVSLLDLCFVCLPCQKGERAEVAARQMTTLLPLWLVQRLKSIRASQMFRLLGRCQKPRFQTLFQRQIHDLEWQDLAHLRRRSLPQPWPPRSLSDRYQSFALALLLLLP